MGASYFNPCFILNFYSIMKMVVIMKKMKNILDLVFQNKIVLIGITVLFFFISYEIIKRFINRQLNRISKDNKLKTKKHTTYLKLLKSIVKYIIIILSALIILQICGINVTSMVAGLGIIATLIGLALQDAFKDIIAGFNIILDDYFSVGDFVEVDGIQGNILEIDLKCTKIKDITNDNILVIGNRNIIKALHISPVVDIEIPLPYEEDTLKMEKIINNIIKETKEKEDVKDVLYLGINRFADSAIIYKIRLIVPIESRFVAKRNTLRRIKLTLDKEKITIPYTQIDIHNKK